MLEHSVTSVSHPESMMVNDEKSPIEIIPYFACNMCPARFYSLPEFKDHYNSVHIAYTCSFCNLYIINKVDLMPHLMHHAAKDPALNPVVLLGEVRCEGCHIMFSQKIIGQFKRHLDICYLRKVKLAKKKQLISDDEESEPNRSPVQELTAKIKSDKEEEIRKEISANGNESAMDAVIGEEISADENDQNESAVDDVQASTSSETNESSPSKIKEALLSPRSRKKHRRLTWKYGSVKKRRRRAPSKCEPESTADVFVQKELFRCDRCYLSFYEEQELANHLKEHEADEAKEVDVVGDADAELSDFPLNPNEDSCIVHESQIATPDIFENNIFEEYPTAIDQPSVNNENSGTLDSLSPTLTTPPTNDDTIYCCDQCESTYKNLNELIEHRLTHDKDFYCPTCKSTCETFQAFKDHIKQVHMIDLKIPTVFRCNFCVQSFATAELKDAHQVEKHSPELAQKNTSKVKRLYARIKSISQLSLLKPPATVDTQDGNEALLKKRTKHNLDDDLGVCSDITDLSVDHREQDCKKSDAMTTNLSFSNKPLDNAPDDATKAALSNCKVIKKRKRGRKKRSSVTESDETSDPISVDNNARRSTRKKLKLEEVPPVKNLRSRKSFLTDCEHFVGKLDEEKNFKELRETPCEDQSDEKIHEQKKSTKKTIIQEKSDDKPPEENHKKPTKKVHEPNEKKLRNSSVEEVKQSEIIVAKSEIKKEAENDLNAFNKLLMSNEKTKPVKARKEKKDKLLLHVKSPVNNTLLNYFTVQKIDELQKTLDACINKSPELSPPKKFTCQKCKKGFQSLPAIETHFTAGECQRNLSKQYECEICNKLFSVRRELTRHIRRSHRNKEIETDSNRRDPVGDVLQDLSQVANTIVAVADDGDGVKSSIVPSRDGKRNYSCYLCHTVFATVVKFNAHLNDEHKNGHLKCDACQAMFKLESRLHEHKDRNHSGDSGDLLLEDTEITIHNCELCSKRFADIYLLKKHIETHCKTSDEFCVCELCGEKFGKISDLKDHVDCHCSGSKKPSKSNKRLYRTRSQHFKD